MLPITRDFGEPHPVLVIRKNASHPDIPYGHKHVTQCSMIYVRQLGPIIISWKCPKWNSWKIRQRKIKKYTSIVPL